MEELVNTDDYHPSLRDIALSRACEQKFTEHRLREYGCEGEEYYFRAYKAGETIIIAQDYDQLEEFERIAGDDCQVLAGFIIDPLVDGVQAVHRYGGCPFYADAYDWLDDGWAGIHADDNDWNWEG